MMPLPAKLGLALAPALLALALGAAGCDSPPANEAPPPGPIAFAADPAGAGPAIVLRSKPNATQLVVEVVSREIPSIHGIAFRLTWDPALLTFSGATAANVWTKDAVMLAKEGTPGQLAVAWTEKGESGGIASGDETILGTLTFDVPGKAGAAITFRPERSRVVDAKGMTVQARWVGGNVPAR